MRDGARARSTRAASEQLVDLAAAGAARLFGTLSRARGRRVFHPHGVGFHGLLTPLGDGQSGASALDGEAEAIVRLSRGLGLPEWLPDPCGLGLRIPDAHGPGRHQDLLMVTSGRASPGPRLGELRERGIAGLEFELEIATVGGAWRPVASLSLRRRLPAAETERLDLDPSNTGGGLQLAGLVNRLRGPSYAGSQKGRGRAYRARGEPR